MSQPATFAAAYPGLLGLDSASMEFPGQAGLVVRVLQKIDLWVQRGQTVVVVGESGCGKTVLLKLLVGLLRPTAGRAIFDGRDLARLRDRELTQQRLRFGYLFQGAALFDSMTVLDNVAFGLRARGMRARGSWSHGLLAENDIRNQVRQHLQDVGLPPEVESRMPAQLSGGMKKRVGLARALALNPEVMLYDEPTTGLDPIMSDVINELIVQIRQRHPVTSIVVTHDMKTVEKVADRVVMLYPLARLQPEERQVLYDGLPDQMASCPDRRVQQFVTGTADRASVERLKDSQDARREG